MSTLAIQQLPEVRQAAALVMAEWQRVRLERPDWPPLQALREAKRRHAETLVTAVTAIQLAKELARNGSWRSMPFSYISIHTNSHLQRKHEEAQQRYARIREFAAEHPGMTMTEIGAEFGCSRTTVAIALQAKGARPLPTAQAELLAT